MSSPSPANLPERALSQMEECPVSDDVSEQQLGKILQSAAFRDSETLKRFLRYSVEHTLHGEGGQLKEYRVGIEVFNRHSSFDPRLDPVVRMAARRLRINRHRVRMRPRRTTLLPRLIIRPHLQPHNQTPMN